MRTLRLCSVASLLWLAPDWSAQAQPTANNDGFRRYNGQMEVVRNGQPRPMTHDARLPTGATVTKDGFIVGPEGHRTELAEGQGCDLRGRPVAVRTTADGRLALAGPGRSAQPAVRPPAPPRSLLETFVGSAGAGKGWGHFKNKKAKKKHGKGKGHGRWKGEDD
ncbi:DUF6799 domain-containing protein [Hymenobacter properus]|uniref:DUF6799 domain-containing protein n=1 Tax=Hymenobacter properus TaxID=2791026 RepID=A0A931BIB8_9BACT|nr:DUF6799 domain-containing protein [Hymenobacter properus]MBF9144139.1 hypothetical protein [Hymenobacter properus]MBR7722955.1 hypothetical protein [Microvirga sp. SRT04]